MSITLSVSVRNDNGFTLIELSVVLVIIGLIVGGVLVGQDLVNAAATRATLAQLEKYQTAAHTFQTKYGGYLPGDIPASYATQFGLLIGGQNRAGDAGRGDGNGIIQGYATGLGAMAEYDQYGETLYFWEDLASAKLIDGNFNTANATSAPTVYPSNAPLFFPSAKVGNGNYIGVYGGGLNANSYYGFPGNSQSYFFIFIPTYVNGGGSCEICNPGLTVNQAYNMDKKIDDGLPTSGKVTAMYPGAQWAADGAVTEWAPNASSASSLTCFDTNSGRYSTGQNGGANLNCGLSFQMQ